MEPGSVRFHVLLRDEEGRGRVAGEYAANARITFPLSRWEEPDGTDA
jgi:hypothetical protein